MNTYEQIFRLDISMHDTPRMEVGHCAGQIVSDPRSDVPWDFDFRILQLCPQVSIGYVLGD